MGAWIHCTLDDVAKILNADCAGVTTLIARGELLALEIGPGELRVAPGDLRRFIIVRKRDLSHAVMAQVGGGRGSEGDNGA